MGAQPQLQMLWPEDKWGAVPDAVVADGYRLRVFREGDRDAYLGLMHKAGFGSFDEAQLRTMEARILPNGFFVIEHVDSGALAVTAMTVHGANEQHPYGGELGYLAGDPEHSGRGLGYAVCCAVLQRYRDAGYRRVYLRTDDFRLAAIKIYLKLGFVPFLFADGMAERWKTVCEELLWTFSPEDWPAAPAVG